MRLTIVKDDNAVNIDGVRRTVDLNDLPESFHVLQSNGDVHELEHRMTVCTHCNTRSKKMNEFVRDFAPYQKYIDAWHVEDARVKAEEKAEAERVAALQAEHAAKEANAAG